MIKIKIYGLYQKYVHDGFTLRDFYKTKKLAEKKKERLTKELHQPYCGPYFEIREIEVIEGSD